MKITEITCKEALHKLSKKGLPYKYDLNVYRGCSHNCAYCYARKSHKYMESDSFDDEIFVKTNIVEALERKLSSKSWQGDVVNLGGVCDSYQAAEREYELLPKILKVMIKYQNPIVLSTKSDLILRDIDLIDQLASVAYVNIPISFSSCSDEISRIVEPGASLPKERLYALRELSKTKANTGFHLFPLLPIIADNYQTLETMVKWAAHSKASYMMTAMLYLTGGCRNNYLDMIRDNFPEHLDNYLHLYSRGSANKEYKAQMHGFINRLRKDFGVSSNYKQFLPRKTNEQMSLF